MPIMQITVRQVPTGKTSQIVYHQISTPLLVRQSLGAKLAALGEKRSYVSGPELSSAPQSALMWCLRP